MEAETRHEGGGSGWAWWWVVAVSGQRRRRLWPRLANHVREGGTGRKKAIGQVELELARNSF